MFIEVFMYHKLFMDSMDFPIQLYLNCRRCLKHMSYRVSVLHHILNFTVYAACCIHVCTVLYFQGWCDGGAHCDILSWASQSLAAPLPMLTPVKLQLENQEPVS